MKFREYMNEAKQMKGSMIGFGVDKSKVRRLQQYIGSWLKRYKIPHDKVENPHISIAQIPDTYDKDELIRTVNQIKKGIVFNPKEIHIFRGEFKDWIVIEYKANMNFINAFYEVSMGHTVKWFGAIRPHVSLFSVEKGSLDEKMWDDIRYSMPKLPKVKAEKVELWNSQFNIEYYKK